MVLLVLLHLAVNIGQSWHDFRALNEQTARRLDTLASTLALHIEDHARVVDLTTVAVGDAIETSTLDNRKLAQLASLDKEILGAVSIAVIDPAGRLLAASDPVIERHAPNLLASQRSMNVESPPYAQPVHYDSRWGLLFVRDHRSEAGTFKGRIAVIVPIDQWLTEDVDFPPGSVALLRSPDETLIARYPSIPGAKPGSRYHIENLKAKGPTPSTSYVVSPLDGDLRLVTSRSVAIGPAGKSLTLDLGYSVEAYRLPWVHSVYLNLAGMATMIALLVGGIVLLRRENRLREQVETWAGFVSTVIGNIPTPIALVDRGTGRITLASETLKDIFGMRATVGAPFANLFADPEDWNDTGVRVSNEPVVMRTRAGIVHMVVQCSDLPDDAGEVEQKGLMLVTLIDVSQQCEQIRQLRTEAEFDALTKLPNRRHFDRASERAVARAQLCQSPLAVLAMDLDHFKEVNDTRGHAAGDRVLELVSERFNAALREQDLPARMGGEEFAALLQGALPERARAIAERVRLAVATPITLDDGHVIHVTASIGVAMYQQGESDLSGAKARADAALYRAKRSGRNRVETECEVAVQDARCGECRT
ncbi:sensor domain-containing diguanylate cyclase [Paraburkholderia dinghuensis]|nr:sensor domain-containing diguanylate cyclase [Paraburkholderia dinghuensis]